MWSRAAKVSHQGINVTFTRRARILTGRCHDRGFNSYRGPQANGIQGNIPGLSGSTFAQASADEEQALRIVLRGEGPCRFGTFLRAMWSRAAKVSHQGINVTFTRRARILTGRCHDRGFNSYRGPRANGIQGNIPGLSGDRPSGSFCMMKDLVDTEYSGEQECSPSRCAPRDVRRVDRIVTDQYPLSTRSSSLRSEGPVLTGAVEESAAVAGGAAFTPPVPGKRSRNPFLETSTT
jgi:hypothetical protein